MRRQQTLRLLLAIPMLACLASAPAAEDSSHDLRIIALGDLPYGDPARVYPPYEALIDRINGLDADIVLHVGDTKGGGACTDALLREQLDFMMRFAAPLLYTPGDNEWTDCHRWGDEGGDPLDRLDFIRSTYFADPGHSLGGTALAVDHQGDAGYPENARLRLGDVGIITAHIVGSNNNFETRDLRAVEEFFARSPASTNWLKAGFEAFADAEVIVLAIHADMFEFDFNEFEGENWLRHSGFREFGSALKSVARGYGKPVLLVFGDSHKHRIFQPFPKYAPNVTAVEVYGYPDMHAVEILIRPGADTPFRFQPVWNPLTLD